MQLTAGLPIAVDIKFMLAQPRPSLRTETELLLKAELRQHDDIVMLPGVEAYKNLPNKTFNTLRYGLAANPPYSHLLKTDEDCYVRLHKLVQAIHALPQPHASPQKLYLGELENPHGFWPIRDPGSKWFIPFEDMSQQDAPIGTKYLAGWGYVVSWDSMQHVISKADLYAEQPMLAPKWYAGLHWEDVMIGLLLNDYATFQPHGGIKAAWKSCEPDTIIRHLDVEALQLMAVLHEADQAGTWDRQAISCKSDPHSYADNDYWDWKRWRDTLKDVPTV
eukprot:jgi/Astpho2/7774/Aster-06066